MILEFVTGAVRQIGRFIGGIPSAFGWSGQGGATTPGGQVCGTVAIYPRVNGTVTVYPPRINGTIAVYPRVNGTVSIAEC